MAKTELTKELEKRIWDETNKQGIFGCFEVTIGWFGNERVDYMTYDTKGIWRCYEIKISKADFHSKAKKTFLGHYNYFVMPKELYEEVKDEIPNHIGVYIIYQDKKYISLIKRPKKQPLGTNEGILKNSMIRSLSRENEKFIKTGDTNYINRLNNEITKLEGEKRENYNKYIRYSNAIYTIYNKYNLNREEIKQIVRDTE